jgi:ribosomal protein S18 acetylase RimI-like enzyme
MLLERFHELDIHRVTTPEEVARLEPGFVAAYRRIFSGEPYFEDFSEQEVAATWRRLTRVRNNITLIATDADGVVHGFGIAIPLSEAHDAARELNGLLPLRATMYLVELGVDEAWRGRKLGKHLVKLRIQLTDPELYSHVVLRVAEGRTATFEMYRSLDFTDMGVSMVVNQRRTDGTVRGDTRYFMSKVLSQVTFDE